jgi:hypothetical protein
MAVEIYLEPELQEMVESEEVTAEWTQLVKDLGMEGQLKLIEPKSSGEIKNPSPYIHMNAKAERVFSIICPQVIDYKRYDKSTIPREVLKEIALAEKEKYFDKICIWYDDASPDPLVVGYIKEGSYSYIKHMIARFGDEILPFDELEVKATNRLHKRMVEKLTAELASVQLTVDNFMNPSRGSGSESSISINFDGVTYSHRQGS